MSIPVALQLYTVRDETAKDFAGTVRRVAEMGYAGVEFAGTGNLTNAQLTDLLAETGLKAVGSHIGIDRFEKELDQVIAFGQALDLKYLGIPYMPEERRGAKGWRKTAAMMNRTGAALKQAGMTLYYHNHAFEWEKVDGERGIDILFEALDPDLVKMEVDVYWVQYAGEDPAAYINKHAGMFPLIHLKDMTSTGDERTFAEVGEGNLDFPAIFRASEAQGAEWYIVEQDRCARPTMESAQISLNNLKAWGKL